MKLSRSDFGTQFLTVIGDAVSVFVAYLLAMFIRYHVLEAAPGINTLSAPYLMMAALYSILVADFLRILRATNKSYFRKYQNGFFNIVSLTGIGSLFFLAFLYIANVKYFSRWALLLFWILSCVLLLVKNAVFQFLLKKIGSKSHNRVLIVGDGKLAKEYGLSVLSDQDADANILGYVGDQKKEDILLEEPGFANYGDGSAALKYLGRISDVQDVIVKQQVAEIVIALEDIEPKIVEEIIRFAEDAKLPVTLISIYEKFLPSRPVVKTICGYNHINAIELGKSTGETATAMLSLLMTIVASFLFIMLIIKKFGIGEFANFKSYESYKVILCVIASFSMYWKIFLSGKVGAVKNFLLSMAVCLGTVVGYEALYCSGKVLDGLLWSECLAVLITVLISFVLNKIIKFMETDSFGLWY